MSSDCSSVDSSFHEIMIDRSFSFEIEIETDIPPIQSKLELADPKSKITKLSRGPIYSVDQEGEISILSNDELKTLAYPEETISFRFDSKIKSFRAPNNVYFTVQELVDKIIEFEQQVRTKRLMGGMIDLSHRHFKSLVPTEETDLFELEWD